MEAWALHRERLTMREREYDPRVATRIKRGAAATAVDYLELRSARAAMIRQFEAKMRDYDAWLLPTLPVIAPLLEPLVQDDELYLKTNLLLLRNPSVINFLDGCAVTLPCRASSGAPVGMMLAAPAMRDHHLLRASLAVEQVLEAAR